MTDDGVLGRNLFKLNTAANFKRFKGLGKGEFLEFA